MIFIISKGHHQLGIVPKYLSSFFNCSGVLTSILCFTLGRHFKIGANFKFWRESSKTKLCEWKYLVTNFEN